MNEQMESVKERPILFSGAMVRALLAGTKTQTRRAVKGQALDWLDAYEFDPGFVASPGNSSLCPYGKPGDRLRVRETFYAFGRWETRFSAKKGRDEWHFIDMTKECGRTYAYDAEEDTPVVGGRDARVTPMWWRRPAIFMPSGASRILLEITEVRVERLQDISEADSQAEGAEPSDGYAGPAGDRHRGWRQAYRLIWDQINGQGAWDSNPWVWAVSFRVLTPSAPLGAQGLNP